MTTRTGLFGRFALYALFGSSIAFSACGDDDGGGPAATGGAGGKTSGGTAGKSTGGNVNAGTGGATTGGTGTGGTTDAGAPSTGGKSTDGGAGGAAGGEAGESGTTGGAAGGETTQGGAGAGGAAGGAGGVAGDAGVGGEGGAVVLENVYHVYVGCGDASGNVELYYIERVTGVVTPGNRIASGSALTAGAIGPDKDRVYVSHQSKGQISTFNRNLDTGRLEARSTTEVPYDAGSGGEGGGGPGANPGTQAITVHPSGDYLYAANFSSSNVYAFALESDGDVGDLLDDASDGANPQDAVVSAATTHVLVPYSGSDEIAVYEVDSDGDLLLEGAPLDLDANTSPRRLAAHPNGDWVYSVNQDSGSITFMTLDEATGAITEVVSTNVALPGGYTGAAESLAIVIGESGQYLYVANQLNGTVDGSINIFAITQTGGNAGRLTLLASGGTVSSRGELLRDIAVSDDGAILVAINEGGDNMTLFNVSGAGGLSFVSTRAVCNSPSFVKIVSP